MGHVVCVSSRAHILCVTVADVSDDAAPTAASVALGSPPLCAATSNAVMFTLLAGTGNTWSGVVLTNVCTAYINLNDGRDCVREIDVTDGHLQCVVVGGKDQIGESADG